MLTYKTTIGKKNTWLHFYHFDGCKLSGNQVPCLTPPQNHTHNHRYYSKKLKFYS